MDFNRLRTGEKIAGIGGLLLLISLWLSWYGIDTSGIPGAAGFAAPSFNAWQAFGLIDLLLFLAAAAAIAHAVLTMTGNSPALPVATSVIVTGLGALGTVLVLFRIINPPGEGGITLKFGIFIGLLSVAAVAYGGWRAMQEEDSPGITQPTPEVRPAPADPAPTATAPAAAPPAAAPPADAPPADPPANQP